MAKIRLIHKGFGMMPGMPYIVSVNGRPVGILQKKEAILTLPEGDYEIGVRCGAYLPVCNLPLLNKIERIRQSRRVLDLGVEGHGKVSAHEEQTTIATFRPTTAETVWNILFDIDLVLWIAEMFVHLPQPWDMVYKLTSDAFFIIWLIRLYFTRKRYFKLSQQ